MSSVHGHLEILDQGYGFLRDIGRNFEPHPTDTFVPAPLIQKMDLYEGIYIEGNGVKGNQKFENLKLSAIKTINAISPREYGQIASLKERVSINPNQRLVFTQSHGDTMGRALDMIVPMGKGQRGLIISPPKAGKTTILKHMARSVLTNHPETNVFVLLVDERPEEVTDFRRELPGAQVLSSSSDQSIAQHLRITKLTMNTVIRTAEIHQDTVVFIDSLTRLARAFNTETESYGKTLTGGLGANAMEIPRRVFGAARNLEDGGSLTIMATILVDTGSRMDDIIFQEFKGTGNLDLRLSRECAEHRVWPAINIRESGTRKEHLLMSRKELGEIINIRRAVSPLDEVAAMSALLEYIEKGETHADHEPTTVKRRNPR
ncbi:MAG: transcription termination factor Rho [Desulfobacterales bacterium]